MGAALRLPAEATVRARPGDVPIPDDFDPSVERALIRLALINARRSVPLQVVAMALVAALGWTAGNRPVGVLVFVLALLVALWRLSLANAAARHADHALCPRDFERSLTANATVTGLMWMLASVGILPLLGRIEEAVYLMLVCGSLVVAAGFLPFAGRAFTVFAGLQLLGLVLAAASDGGWWALGMAALALLFGRSLLNAAHAYRETVSSAIRSEAQANHALEELEQSRAAERCASEAKTRFLATMSHEIRTPMNGVLGAIDLLRHSDLTPTQYALAATAASSSESLLRIVNDVLDHAQLESGRFTLVERPTDLASLAASVVRLFQPNAEAKGLRLDLMVVGGAASAVLVDASRVKQVLMNLVGNAIKFTERGSVGVELQTVRSGDGRVRVSLHVRDTGSGFDDQVRSRLFEPFFQDREATRHGGSGLGLSICQRIVRQMEGCIDVESRPGVGSLFRVELVLPAADDAEVQDAADSPPGDGDTLRLRGHVLLVDDNMVNRTIATEMLRSLGVEVDEAADGAQALRRLAVRDYDLVLMDVEMPVLDGHAASRAQRERERRLALPRTTILALTANAFAEDVAAALDAGMDGHLAKPFTLVQLRAVLATRLRSFASQSLA